ncbi:MAG: glycosyltransferase family 2 protein [Bacteroidales bacterium]|nr:glycosyltransferase family 2 protein [Bacteroidales bacterium]
MINYSIIIPHYDIPDLLGRCLRSIPEREDVQVIVVDDNSPDVENYLDVIPELRRTNVEFYVTKDKLGAGHVRNVGLSHAKGKWLVFADSDDFFVDDFSQILDEYLNDEHDIIYFNIKSCDCYDTSRLFEADKLRTYKETNNDLFLRVFYTEPWGKFIKRVIVTKNNISFQETKAHNDLLFAVKTGLLAGQVLAVDRPLYCYVIREGSLGHFKGIEPFEKLCDRIQAWHCTQLFLEEYGLRTNLYLPVLTCVRTLKNSLRNYIKLIVFMRNNNLRYVRAFFDTLKYLCLRSINLKALSYQWLLSSDSIDKFVKRQ